MPINLKDSNIVQSSSTNSSSNSSSWFSIAVAATTAAVGVMAVVTFMKQKRKRRSVCIYLDYNGTTPIYPQVVKGMMPYFTKHYGNPSSAHYYGQEPRKAIDHARKQILKYLLGITNVTVTDLSSIIFTGCGTESDNMAIQLAIQSTKHLFTSSTINRPHIVTSNVEHPAIEQYLRYLELETKQIDVTYVSVDGEGQVFADDVINAIRPNTILVTIMVANNECGTIQPIKKISTECRKLGVLVHTDAAQAVGKISIQLHDLGNPDMISIVGHKFGCPKGIAALYIRPNCLEENNRQLSQNHNKYGTILIGGGQEYGKRGGTENTPYVVGLGISSELVYNNLTKNSKHMETMRTRLLHNLQNKLGHDNIRVNGPTDPNKRLPNTLSIGFWNIHSGRLLSSIGHVVAASAGATCHGTGSISAVLVAMKVPESFARGTLRLSLGPSTTLEEIDDASEIIAQAVRAQWKGSNLVIT